MHFSVMAEESFSLLAVRPDGTYLDATTGFGGHTAPVACGFRRVEVEYWSTGGKEQWHETSISFKWSSTRINLMR